MPKRSALDQAVLQFFGGNPSDISKITVSLLLGLFFDNENKPVKVTKRAMREAFEYVSNHGWPSPKWGDEDGDATFSFILKTKAPCPACGQNVNGLIGAIATCKCGTTLRRYDTGEWAPYPVRQPKGRKTSATR